MVGKKEFMDALNGPKGSLDALLEVMNEQEVRDTIKLALDDLSKSLLKDETTLRDYFAAKAMQGLTQNMEAWALQVDSVALESYAMADAMLRAREV